LALIGRLRFSHSHSTLENDGREVRSEIVAKVQPVLSAALAGLEAGKTQILFEKVIDT
jgi:hypothetical protein